MNQPRFETFEGIHNREQDAWRGPPYKGAFYWRYRAKNGRITAVSGEAFTSMAHAKRAVWDLCKDFATMGDPEPVEIEDGEGG